MLKRYKDFINESKEWIHEGDFEVTKDMVKNGHYIEGMIPDIITGYFYCDNNKLTSLKGSPVKIVESFNCSYNKLTSLEGGPKEVGGYFNCSNNKLSSLEVGPVKVGRSFYCGNNKLTSLEGSPKEVVGDFNCNNNKLTSLEGSPKEVGGDFNCNNNKLTSLKGAPKEVGRYFDCDDNKKDLSLESFFIESGLYKDDYFVDLLSWVINTNRDIEDIKSWPKGFLNSNIGKSAINIGKFKL